MNAKWIRQLEMSERQQDAHEQLKIGTKKDDVSRFFTEHGMSFGILHFEALGTLHTSGCAPQAHCGDEVILQVRVKLESQHVD